MNKKDKVLSALDLAFTKSAEFQKGVRYDQMKVVYLGLREDMLHLDMDSLPIQIYVRALDVKAYMKLFWDTTDNADVNQAYHIKLKALERASELTYGEDQLLPAVMHTLNSYLEGLSIDEILENEQNLNNLEYLTERIHDTLHNEKRDVDPL